MDYFRGKYFSVTSNRSIKQLSHFGNFFLNIQIISNVFNIFKIKSKIFLLDTFPVAFKMVTPTFE